MTGLWIRKKQKSYKRYVGDKENNLNTDTAY